MFDHAYATLYECRAIIGKRLVSTKNDRELWRAVTTWPDYLNHHIAAERGQMVPVSLTTAPHLYQRDENYFALAETFAEHGALMSTGSDDVKAMQTGALPVLTLTFGPDIDASSVLAWSGTLRHHGLRAGSTVDPNSVYPWASILGTHAIAPDSPQHRRARLVSRLELRDRTFMLSRDMRRQVAAATTVYVGLDAEGADYDVFSALVPGRFDTSYMRQRLLDRVAEVAYTYGQYANVYDEQQSDPSVFEAVEPSTDVMAEVEAPAAD